MNVPESRLEEIRALYTDGLNLQAHAKALEAGPYREWEGASARVLAGRLIAHLGAPRLAFAMKQSTAKRHPDHPEALYYYACEVLTRCGPWSTIRYIEDRMRTVDGRGSDDVRSSWYALYAETLGRLRDFASAWEWQERAERFPRLDPWPLVCRAHLLEMEDRRPEAIEVAREALKSRPFYRPATTLLAGLLADADRIDEALELLREADRRIESNTVAAQLGYLLSEVQRHDEARAAWERGRQRQRAGG